ncbi:hypothetical protein Ddc_16389 [Ditylenchus destructor]|nr:hypothetical protein Ddc_16389 [Ditylenchus destructor]
MAPLRSLLLLVIFTVILYEVHSLGVCTHQGKTYANGEEWTYRSFIMRCEVQPNYWKTQVVACVSLLGDRIPVGSQIRDRHGVWKCYQDEETGSTKLVQNP